MSRRNYNTDSSKEDDYKDLFVFGYSCKLFTDDEKAMEIDRGKHLIPWMGDENLLIDRYDGRGHLDDFRQFTSEMTYDVIRSEEEKSREDEIDKERYGDLYMDVEETLLYEEEEMKRASEYEVRYGAVSYVYNEETSQEDELNATQQEEKDEQADECNPFVSHENMNLPSNMEVPKTVKHHKVIEKTAWFISKQNLQMEILIKTRQKNNPAFNFLNFDDVLHPYYKHLLIEMKQGRYSTPVEEEKAPESKLEHVEIQISSQEFLKSVEEKLPPRLVRDTCYDKLLNNLRKHIPLQPPPPPPPVTQSETPVVENDDPLNPPASMQPSNNGIVDPQIPSIVPPPPDKKFLIDKMATYVARNGSDFEIVVRKKDDQRFDFIREGHLWHNYYKMRKVVIEQELNANKMKTAKQTEMKHVEVTQLEKENKKELKSISFSIKYKETTEKVIQQNVLSDEEGGVVAEKSNDVCQLQQEQQQIDEVVGGDDNDASEINDNNVSSHECVVEPVLSVRECSKTHLLITPPIIKNIEPITKKRSLSPELPTLAKKKRSRSKTPEYGPKMKPPVYCPKPRSPVYGPDLPPKGFLMNRAASGDAERDKATQDLKLECQTKVSSSFGTNSQLRNGLKSDGSRRSRLRSRERSRSREQQRSRSRDKRRSRPRGKRRSRSKERQKSRSFSGLKRSRLRSKERRRSKSRSPSNKRSRLKSPILKKSQSRSPQKSSKKHKSSKLKSSRRRSPELESIKRNSSGARNSSKKRKSSKKPKKRKNHHHKHKKERTSSPIVLDLTSDEVVDLTQD